MGGTTFCSIPEFLLTFPELFAAVIFRNGVGFLSGGRASSDMLPLPPSLGIVDWADLVTSKGIPLFHTFSAGFTEDPEPLNISVSDRRISFMLAVPGRESAAGLPRIAEGVEHDLV